MTTAVELEKKAELLRQIEAVVDDWVRGAIGATHALDAIYDITRGVE